MMSGMSSMPRLASTRSPSGVVGPLAPSATSVTLIRSATGPVISPPSAAGMRMSASTSHRSFLEICCAFGYPATVRRMLDGLS